MPGSGTRTFLEPDHYEASLRQAQIEILIALTPQFKARLTWAELHDLEVLRCEEDFPRVAYVRLSPRLSFVTFPAHSGPLPMWGGAELRTQYPAPLTVWINCASKPLSTLLRNRLMWVSTTFVWGSK
jgi:hypothetical protein